MVWRCNSAAEFPVPHFSIYTLNNGHHKSTFLPIRSQRKATAGSQTQAKFCTGSLRMNPNVTVCLSHKSKVPHKVRSLLTGNLIMRASHRHPPSAFPQVCKHVNPLSPMGLFLTWRQDQVQEINPSYLCVLQSRYYTFIAPTNELFILCFVVMLFLSTAQWWHRRFCISKFCTTHLPKCVVTKIYKIQKYGLEPSQST